MASRRKHEARTRKERVQEKGEAMTKKVPVLKERTLQ